MAKEITKTKKVADENISKEDVRAPFSLLNYIVFGGGLLDIIIGWLLLRGGHITIAPVMLILGYCVIIPLAIILRTGSKTKETT